MSIFTLKEKVLETFAVEYQPPELKLASEKILTVIPSNDLGGKFVIRNAFTPQLMDTRVGLYAEAPLFVDGVKVQEGVYTITSHRLKTLILKDEVEALNEIGITNYAVDRIKELKTSLLVEKEYIVANLLASTSNKTSPANKWDTENATIEKDLAEAVEEFKSNANIYPNKLIIPQKVWNVMLMDPTLRSLFTLIPARKEQTLDIHTILSQRFPFITDVIIVDAVIQVKKNAPASSIWGDDVYLIYSVPRGDKRTFTAIGEFRYQDWTVRRIDSEDPEGEFIILQAKYDIQVICPNAIYKIEKVLT